MKSKLIIFFLIISTFIRAAEFPDYIKDFGDMAETSYKRLDTFYPELAGISLLTGLMIWQGDQYIRKNLVDINKKQFESPFLRAAAWPAKGYGKNNKNVILMFAGLTMSSYLYGQAFDHQKAVETSYLLTESFVFTAGIIEMSKFILGRSRPFNDLGTQKFHFFNKHSRNHSMPSGHTGLAVAMANTIALSSESYYIKIPCYLWAVSAGLQRVGFDVHWTSDVIIGGLIGYGISTFLHHNYYQIENNQEIQPTINFNFVIPL